MPQPAPPQSARLFADRRPAVLLLCASVAIAAAVALAGEPTRRALLWTIGIVLVLALARAALLVLAARAAGADPEPEKPGGEGGSEPAARTHGSVRRPGPAPLPPVGGPR